MIYLSQPNAGLLLKTVNFFQDGSIFKWAFVPGWIAMEKTNKKLRFFKLLF